MPTNAGRQVSEVSEKLHAATAGGVARIVFRAAEKHNAFDDRFIADLTRLLIGFQHDENIHTLVIAAEGASFSAGADLEWMKRAAAGSRVDNYADARALAGLMRTLDGMPQTTIAAVQGAAFGGGVGLVACCDIAIASTASRFALSEVKLGLVPAAISPFVVAAIGARQARRYFQTAEIFDAAEALRIGLVHDVVAPDDLESRVGEVLAALSKGGSRARRAAKRLVADVACRTVDDELSEMTAVAIADIRSGDEAREGLNAFFERRSPAWIPGK